MNRNPNVDRNEKVDSFVESMTPPKPDFKIHPPTSVSELFVGYDKETVGTTVEGGQGMNWYMALCTFLMYLSAIGFVISGIQYIFGLMYGNSYLADITYTLYPMLRFVDIAMGIVYLAFAAAILYTRMRLAKFMKDGPALWLWLILVNLGIGIVYALLAQVAKGNVDFGALLATIIVTCLFGGIGYCLNKTYFDKRARLFVNE